MKLSSKSIFSPGHSREPSQMSLSSSFSRRLVSNGSIKGGGQASPMFPTVSRKRGPGFENPEPSSPKVTCIGQVRVKAKKQGKKMRGARSKRRSGGEASFRRTEQNFQVALNPDLTRQKSQKNQTSQYQQQECLPNRNQRWVHFPLTICEALKGFGAEFSCFFPCRSSCTREKEEKAGGGGGGGRRSRWVVTMQEGDAAKGMKEIELVMGEKEEGEDRTRERRHVFEDIDFDEIEKLKDEEFVGNEEGEEKGRVSICIPPKNALLLMRCRSDPVKVAALANRFLEPTIHKQAEDEEQVPMEEDNTIHASEKGIAFLDRKEEAEEATNPKTNQVAEPIEEEDANGDEQVETFHSSSENDEKLKDEENDDVQSSQLSPTLPLSEPSEPLKTEVEVKGSAEEEEKVTEAAAAEDEEEEEKGSKEREKGSNLERESESLPECLLLMMCEPKLSIEVSKETWVCTADFIRWLPPRSAGKTGGGDRQAKKRVAVESKPPVPQPQPPSIQLARSSCSFPAPMAGNNGCEPSILKRCKSEPRGLAVAKLAPEGCSRNNRKLMEPHSTARLGTGAARVGF